VIPNGRRLLVHDPDAPDYLRPRIYGSFPGMVGDLRSCLPATGSYRRLNRAVIYK
jgi:hypothetical protein